MYPNKSILIIEDDLSLAISLKESLSRHFSLRIYIADGISTSIQILESNHVELIIADWMLGNAQTSLEIIKYSQENFPQTKILMLTKKRLCDDRIEAYRAGADAYLCKPFDNQELLLLVTKLMHSYKIVENSIISSNKLRLHLASGEIEIAGNMIHLRPKEMEIFKILFINHPHIISKKQLLNCVWPNIDAQPSFNTVEVYIRRLRQLLRPYGISLKNKRGYGYYFSLKTGNEQ